MSPEIRWGRLFTLVRRTEADDLEAQVKALKELQQQPGFRGGRLASKKKRAGLMTAFKRKWTNMVKSIFKHRQKPVSSRR